MAEELKERRDHYKEVYKALPKRVREHASVSSFSMGVADVGHVAITSAFRNFGRTYRMKIEYNYDTKSGINIKDKSWYMRKDGTFCYSVAAEHLTVAFDQMQALKARRKEGRSVAKVRGDRLAAVFASDPLLSSLDVKIGVSPAPETEVGAVLVHFRNADGGRFARLRSDDGKVFDGTVTVDGLSPAQVIALVTVLQMRKLNAIELISLSDDSLLGPAIRAMVEEEEGEDA